MLHDLYLDAIENKRERIAGISKEMNSKILAKARDLWVPYEPKPFASALVGVDSSFNSHHFQGFHLCAIDAVCVNIDGDVKGKRFESSIMPTERRQLEAKSMVMETQVALESADDADLVLVDGSLLSRFVLSHDSAVKSALDLTDIHSNIVFVSKSSDVKEIFSQMGSRVGDIFYFNMVGNQAGYSKPYVVKKHQQKYDAEFTFSFVRLGEFTPLMKLEFRGIVDEYDLKKIIDKLAMGSVSGYPYVLKLAHNIAVITDEDINRLISIYGLKNEINARQLIS